MAKKMYIGSGNIAHNVKSLYIGVGGVARKIKKGYIGVNGVARLFYEREKQLSVINNLATTRNYDGLSGSNGVHAIFFGGSGRKESSGYGQYITIYNTQLIQTILTIALDFNSTSASVMTCARLGNDTIYSVSYYSTSGQSYKVLALNQSLVQSFTNIKYSTDNMRHRIYIEFDDSYSKILGYETYGDASYGIMCYYNTSHIETLQQFSNASASGSHFYDSYICISNGWSYRGYISRINPNMTVTDGLVSSEAGYDMTRGDDWRTTYARVNNYLILKSWYRVDSSSGLDGHCEKFTQSLVKSTYNFPVQAYAKGSTGACCSTIDLLYSVTMNGGTIYAISPNLVNITVGKTNPDYKLRTLLAPTGDYIILNGGYYSNWSGGSSSHYFNTVDAVKFT